MLLVAWPPLYDHGHNYHQGYGVSNVKLHTEVSPLPPGDQLNLAISRVHESKPPTLPLVVLPYSQPRNLAS
jgi:hypothetical protein